MSGDEQDTSVPEDPLESGKLYEFDKCLGTYNANDWNYQFVIKDSYGDEIYYDLGYFEISFCGNVLKQHGGNFTEDRTFFNHVEQITPPMIRQQGQPIYQLSLPYQALLLVRLINPVVNACPSNSNKGIINSEVN